MLDFLNLFEDHYENGPNYLFSMEARKTFVVFLKKHSIWPTLKWD